MDVTPSTPDLAERLRGVARSKAANREAYEAMMGALWRALERELDLIGKHGTPDQCERYALLLTETHQADVTDVHCIYEELTMLERMIEGRRREVEALQAGDEMGAKTATERAERIIRQFRGVRSALDAAGLRRASFTISGDRKAHISIPVDSAEEFEAHRTRVRRLLRARISSGERLALSWSGVKALPPIVLPD